jgi:hypothetical protein
MSNRFLFTLLLIITGTVASAQSQDPVKTRSQFTQPGKMAPVKLSAMSIKDTTTHKRLFINYPIKKEWYHEGTMVDSGSLGKVYQMPIDNMLCLVPDVAKTARMPVKEIYGTERMPNAFSRKNAHAPGR